MQTLANRNIDSDFRYWSQSTEYRIKFDRISYQSLIKCCSAKNKKTISTWKLIKRLIQTKDTFKQTNLTFHFFFISKFLISASKMNGIHSSCVSHGSLFICPKKTDCPLLRLAVRSNKCDFFIGCGPQNPEITIKRSFIDKPESIRRSKWKVHNGCSHSCLVCSCPPIFHFTASKKKRSEKVKPKRKRKSEIEQTLEETILQSIEKIEHEEMMTVKFR